VCSRLSNACCGITRGTYELGATNRLHRPGWNNLSEAIAIEDWLQVSMVQEPRDATRREQNSQRGAYSAQDTAHNHAQANADNHMITTSHRAFARGSRDCKLQSQLDVNGGTMTRHFVFCTFVQNSAIHSAARRVGQLDWLVWLEIRMLSDRQPRPEPQRQRTSRGPWSRHPRFG
jgi:hypothetical protein